MRAPLLATLAALAVPLLGLAELGGQLYVSQRAPSLQEWRSVAPEVQRHQKPGDLTIISPSWAEPNARHAFGNELMPLAQVARPDETGFAHALEVSVVGTSSPLLLGWPVVEQHESGKFVLRRRKNPNFVPVLYDFVDHVEPSAASAFFGRKERQTCSWTDSGRVKSGGLGGNPTFPAKRFACGRSQWTFVGVTVIDDHQEYRPRRCIWAHPTKDGSIGVRFERASLGSEIRGYSGLPWVHERNWKGAPISLVVRVEGQEVGRQVHNDGDGWQHFSFPLSGRAGTRGTVEFEVLTSDATNRHFCFHADSR